MSELKGCPSQHGTPAPPPSEEDVAGAAKRMAGVNWSADGERLDRSWDMAPEAVRENYRRMARAALGVQP